MHTSNGDDRRKHRNSHLRWVRIGDLKAHPRAQREFRPHRANDLASKFNLEGMGFIVVSKHGSNSWVIDGQHRVAALKILGFADDDTIQCELYEDLTEEQDAELFLERNDYLNIAALDKYKNAVLAGREDETEIDRCVRAQGLRVGGNGIKAVSALREAFRRTGMVGLGTTLRIIRDAYGERGFEGPVIQGVALTVQRYNGKLDEAQTIKALAGAKGGLNGLMTQAARARETYGQSKAQCVAATAISFYNRVPGGKKLPNWWKETNQT